MVEELFEEGGAETTLTNFSAENHLVLLLTEGHGVFDKEKVTQFVQFEQYGVRVVTLQQAALHDRRALGGEIDITRQETPTQVGVKEACHVVLVEKVGGVEHVSLEIAKPSHIVKDAAPIFPQIFFGQREGDAHLIIIVGALETVVVVLSLFGFFQNLLEAGAIDAVGNEGAQHAFQKIPGFVGFPAAEFVGQFVRHEMNFFGISRTRQKRVETFLKTRDSVANVAFSTQKRHKKWCVFDKTTFISYFCGASRTFSAYK